MHNSSHRVVAPRTALLLNMHIILQPCNISPLLNSEHTSSSSSLPFHPWPGYRPRTTALHPSLSWAIFWSPLQLYPPLFISSSIHLLHVVLGLPLFLCPWGFHVKECRVMLPGGFLRVWPSHRHFRCPSSSDIAFCPVLSHNSSFRILSGHLILNIFLRHVLTKVWSLFRRVLVSFQVSHPYKSIDFTNQVNASL